MAKAKSRLYTYRCGRKIDLRKRPDQFVVRRLPDELSRAGFADTEQMSSASARVACAKDKLEARMAAARKLAPTHHAYEERETETDFLITDRLLVTFKEPQTAQKAGEFAGRYALETLHKYSNTKFLFRLTDDTGMNPVKLVVKLTEDDDDIALVEHDLNMRMKKYEPLPSDPAYARQWHLHPRHQHAEFDPRSSSLCEQAWQRLDSFGDENVVVGVTDDGCQLDHPDFGPAKFAGWGYFQGIVLFKRGDPGAQGSLMYETGANHGTSCAGVIAAESDGEMTVGAAAGCKLVPIKWESSGPSLFISDSKLLTALDYVADKVDVLSNSWGGVPTSNWSNDVTDRITELARTGGRRGGGIVFLWAAGNENCPISHTNTILVPYTDGWKFSAGSWRWVGPDKTRRFENNLVGLPGLMHVAALASTAQRSHYSNFGTGIEICAPSSNSHAYFRMEVDGLGVTTATGEGNQVTDRFGGTSSATPLTAGIAALVISANPSLSAEEVISVLKQTASKDLDMTGYPRTPPSSFDPNTSWDVCPVTPFDAGDFADIGDADGTWSAWFGHGKVDASAAVERALELAGEQTGTVRLEKIVNLDVPDSDPAGVVSRLFVQDPGRIQRLRVSVDIKHTYIGDLVVRLRGPSGTTVELHDREGGRTDNLIRTFDEVSTPGLVALHGQSIGGAWSLEVSDHAPIDRGQLQRWGLEAEVTMDSAIRVESTPSAAIPDDDEVGITDKIIVNETRDVAAIEVDVDITHTWIGDLLVELSHADGPKVVLHRRTGFDSQNINRSFRTEDVPDLANFVGESAAGEWVLKVSDREGRDVGKLNRWALSIA